MLRSLYLSRSKEKSSTLKSVILAGVYDIKKLKLKFRDDIDIRYNSLEDYLDIEGLSKGYLLIFNFNKNKNYINKRYTVKEKEIFEVII